MPLLYGVRIKCKSIMVCLASEWDKSILFFIAHLCPVYYDNSRVAVKKRIYESSPVHKTNELMRIDRVHSYAILKNWQFDRSRRLFSPLKSNLFGRFEFAMPLQAPERGDFDCP